MGSAIIWRVIALGGIFLVLGFVWWIIQIVANWRIFTKAGEAGWKSIIPIYGDYIAYKISWRTSYFWLTIILGAISSYLTSLTADGGSFLLSALAGLLSLVLLVFSFMYSLKRARAFGKGVGFALGLFFFEPIFLVILGFGDARYLGPDR